MSRIGAGTSATTGIGMGLAGLAAFISARALPSDDALRSGLQVISVVLVIVGGVLLLAAWVVGGDTPRTQPTQSFAGGQGGQAPGAGGGGGAGHIGGTGGAGGGNVTLLYDADGKVSGYGVSGGGGGEGGWTDGGGGAGGGGGGAAGGPIDLPEYLRSVGLDPRDVLARYTWSHYGIADSEP